MRPCVALAQLIPVARSWWHQRHSAVLAFRGARLLTLRRNAYCMHMHAFRRQWTVEDLHDLPDDGQRYEVIDGELFVTPSPSADHQHALSLLFRLIADYLDRERIGHPFFSPSDITFSPRRGG